MLKIFIGYDPNETVAYHVLAHSIMRHASVAVSITPLILSQLPMTRERTPTQSTEFSFSRFLVPWLCNYEGQALFMDCDMLVRADIAGLFAAKHAAPVAVVKHDYTPSTETKFLDQPQSVYAKKNWSSVMLFNNEFCRNLTPSLVNSATGLYLHQFQWAENVAELDRSWNHLVGEYPKNPDVNCVHFTLGTPCFARYADCEYAQEWRDEKSRMTYHNPVGEFKLSQRKGT